MIDQVLNELSFCRFKEPERPCAAADRRQARQWMDTLVRTLSATAKLGLPRSLRTLGSLSDQKIAPGYSVAQWRNDPQVNHELRQLFRLYSTKSPLLDGVLESFVDRARGCEGKFQGFECKGLLAAYLLDSVAISLPSDAAWRANKLEIVLSELDEDGLNESAQPILHCSSPEHVAGHAAELTSRQRQIVATGRDLVENRDRLLPNIEFCHDSEVALSALGQNDPGLSWVRRCLFELNDYCAQWLMGPFHHEELRCRPTPESESVSNNPELRRLRTFVCPDGEIRYFQWHLKNIGRNLRLYYFPSEKEHIVIVGYIGPHLQTQRYC
jgi:hypothetical protein